MRTDASGLPGQARAALDEYLAALDKALPGFTRGVYLTGSAALGDWQPGSSDLDILTVTEHPLGEEGLDALAELHASMPGRPYRDAIYVPAAALGARDDEDDAAGYPAAVDGVFHRARHRPEPVLWATLDRHALTMRGPAASDLKAGPDPDWLREWNHGNLESYWRPWSAAVRLRLAERDREESVPADIVAWAVLGPGRLHATITTGEIISKTAAAGYTAELAPRHAGLLDLAKQYRLGDDAISFTVADGRAACDLVDAVVNDAARMRGQCGAT